MVSARTRACVRGVASASRHPEEGQWLIRPSGRESTVYTQRQMHGGVSAMHTAPCSTQVEVTCSMACTVCVCVRNNETGGSPQV